MSNGPTDCEELLGRLLEGFYINGNGNLEWIYIEDATVAEVMSIELENRLIQLKLDHDIKDISK